jgi:hypothetical protein
MADLSDRADDALTQVAAAPYFRVAGLLRVTLLLRRARVVTRSRMADLSDRADDALTQVAAAPYFRVAGLLGVTLLLRRAWIVARSRIADLADRACDAIARIGCATGAPVAAVARGRARVVSGTRVVARSAETNFTDRTHHVVTWSGRARVEVAVHVGCRARLTGAQVLTLASHARLLAQARTVIRDQVGRKERKVRRGAVCLVLVGVVPGGRQWRPAGRVVGVGDNARVRLLLDADHDAGREVLALWAESIHRASRTGRGDVARPRSKRPWSRRQRCL